MRRFFQKNIKRVISAFLALVLAVSFLCTQTVSASAYYTFTADVTLNSESAILYSIDAEQIVYEKNPDQLVSPGPLAQIMTAVIVLEQCDDLDGTTITADSSLYTEFYTYEEVDDVRYADIDDGDVLTVREYLYALLLTSSCESAVILADYFGGLNGTSGFVEMMNEKATELGCTSTVFTNATGLYDANQMTTARDLLTITTYALTLSDFTEIATTQSFTPTTANTTNHGDGTDWVWTHSNTMMDESSDYYYSGAAGIKTGNLNVEGRSIITEATRDGSTYLVVLLNAPFDDEDGDLQYYHLEDASALFDWAFEYLTYVTMLEDDEEIAEVEVSLSDGNDYVLVRPETDCVILWDSDVDSSAVQRVIELDEDVMAPIEEGQELGTISLKFSGEIIASVPLVAVSDVERSFSKYYLYAFENFPHSPWFRYGLIAATILSVLYIALCIYASYRAKRNVTPEDPIHLIPHATEYEDRPQQDLRRNDTVFYHGPDYVPPDPNDMSEDDDDDWNQQHHNDDSTSRPIW